MTTAPAAKKPASSVKRKANRPLKFAVDCQVAADYGAKRSRVVGTLTGVGCEERGGKILEECGRVSTMTDKVNWQSVKWGDGSRYEGLVKDNMCHLRGVFTYGNGDKYLGEYANNAMDGYGVYVWADGTLYRGQWKNGMMNGCGVKITKQPNGHLIAEEGEFVNDEWAGNIMACDVRQARNAAADADVAAQMARAFELHPEPIPKAPEKPIKSKSKPSNNKKNSGEKPAAAVVAKTPAQIKSAAAHGPVPATLNHEPPSSSSRGANPLVAVRTTAQHAAESVSRSAHAAIQQSQNAWQGVTTKVQSWDIGSRAANEMQKVTEGVKSGGQRFGDAAKGSFQQVGATMNSFREQNLKPIKEQTVEFLQGLVKDVQRRLPQAKPQP